jgi:hypothetical protein
MEGQPWFDANRRLREQGGFVYRSIVLEMVVLVLLCCWVLVLVLGGLVRRCWRWRWRYAGAGAGASCAADAVLLLWIKKVL